MSNTTEVNSRTAVGTITSDKMTNTIVVLVERKVKHPKYGKYTKKSTKMHVHDAQSIGKIGDKVKIRETKPFSKTKTWELVEILSS